MENKIKKSEFSRVNNIGKTIWGHTITKEEFYCNNADGKKVLHLNKLGWEAPSVYITPEGEEVHGFVPGDNFYEEIIEELKSYPDRYRAGNTVRKSIPGSQYDIIAVWYPEVKMINWYFCKCYEYCIA